MSGPRRIAASRLLIDRFAIQYQHGVLSQGRAVTTNVVIKKKGISRGSIGGAGLIRASRSDSQLARQMR